MRGEVKFISRRGDNDFLKWRGFFFRCKDGQVPVRTYMYSYSLLWAAVSLNSVKKTQVRCSYHYFFPPTEPASGGMEGSLALRGTSACMYVVTAGGYLRAGTTNPRYRYYWYPSRVTGSTSLGLLYSRLQGCLSFFLSSGPSSYVSATLGPVGSQPNTTPNPGISLNVTVHYSFFWNIWRYYRLLIRYRLF